MLHWLGRTYTKRIVNVNVNIMLAGLLALAPTLLVVHLATAWGMADRLAGRLRVNPEWVINGVTFAADVLFDVAIYYTLHWLANHWPRIMLLRGTGKDKPHLTFFRDATLVQVERMALSPLLYVLFLGTQHLLIVKGLGPVKATLIGFAAGIFVARSLHTVWMIRQARRRRAVASVGDIVRGPDASKSPKGSVGSGV